MSSNLNNVKMTKKSRPYHHGNLRTALIAAAEAVITERGVDGFSLREAARRAGVSPAAPGHHFGDARGLLTAVATAAFTELGDVLAAAAAVPGDRRPRLEAQGAAYVGFALAHPAAFDLMWRRAVVDAADPDFVAAGRSSMVSQNWQSKTCSAAIPAPASAPLQRCSPLSWLLWISDNPHPGLRASMSRRNRLGWPLINREAPAS